MSKQWGHGFWTGMDTGFKRGSEISGTVEAMVLAEKMRVMLNQLTQLIRDDKLPDQFILIHAMHDVLRPHIPAEVKAPQETDVAA